MMCHVIIAWSIWIIRLGGDGARTRVTLGLMIPHKDHIRESSHHERHGVHESIIHFFIVKTKGFVHGEKRIVRVRNVTKVVNEIKVGSDTVDVFVGRD
ncbi:hypothetical protein PsorP6_011425 [Peronosclerospora sorghi]|uniref:Uncharacterized protein n=1 Tax=Peronosclerospora sorghi TaxID=230839 RepID=A0ACC0WLX1_9STRA|nr:hypothetical protein PsorP6_011425 [Peronosclerospora sorghi]